MDHFSSGPLLLEHGRLVAVGYRAHELYYVHNVIGIAAKPRETIRNFHTRSDEAEVGGQLAGTWR
jgi:hypothetical protein